MKTRLAQHLAQLTQHLAQRFAEFIRATIFIPDARVGWLLTAVDAGERLIREHSIEAIYSSSPPYTPALIARALKRKTGLRWVVGMRDPWTGFLSTPKRWWLPALIDRALERSVFHKADFIECAWEGIIKDIRGKVPDLAPHKLRHIPNGFDSTDYPRDDSQSAEVARNQRFTITYTGTMYGRRNPESLFAAVRLLIEHGKIFPNEIIMRFVGRFGADIKATFEAFPHQESLEIIGYMPHEDSIRALLRSDALLLIVDEAKESEEIVPGKVYEYMGAGKPIIAIAPTDGAIARLLGETRAGSIAPQEDAERLAAIVLNYFNDWKNGTHAFAPDHEKVARYERRNATKELAALLSGNTHEG